MMCQALGRGDHLSEQVTFMLRPESHPCKKQGAELASWRAQTGEALRVGLGELRNRGAWSQLEGEVGVGAGERGRAVLQEHGEEPRFIWTVV